MIEIHMTEVIISTGEGPNGLKVFVADDKRSGIRVLIPMDEKAARAVASALTNGLMIVNTIPPGELAQ